MQQPLDHLLRSFVENSLPRVLLVDILQLQALELALEFAQGVL